jgi:hypothetical protein
MLGNPLKVSSYISVILLELKSLKSSSSIIYTSLLLERNDTHKEVSIKSSLKESTSIDVILFSQKDL